MSYRPAQQSGVTSGVPTGQARSIPTGSRAQPNLARDIEGELFDVVADNLATLTWSTEEGENVIIHGPSDFALLKGFKNALLALRNDFAGEGRLLVDADKKEDFNRRLLLL